MSLTAPLIRTIAHEVAQRFPEMREVQPQVQAQPAPKMPGHREASAQYILTFKTQHVGPSGKNLPRIVRVVANEHGQVIKMSTSR